MGKVMLMRRFEHDYSIAGLFYEVLIYASNGRRYRLTDFNCTDSCDWFSMGTENDPQILLLGRKIDMVYCWLDVKKHSINN